MARSIKDITRQVKEQADIVAIVGRHVPLKKAGTSYKACCPFHKEKTPSFNVVPSKGIFHCFGCGASGSVIDFVMRTEHLEFMEALRLLAKDLGIEIPAPGGPQEREARDAAEKQRRALQSVMEFALEWFRGNLESRRNAIAADYLEHRGIEPKIAEAFQLGAALEGWAHLRDAAVAKGFSDDLLIEAGLCKRHESRGTVYDGFRHRLIFPIFDHRGRPIAFGGRELASESQGAKYINSPETALYKKGRNLYALNVAEKAIADSGYAILTEGYMDTIMAHQFGFTQAVASLGTALTPEQARLLKRYASRVHFLYDGDMAGQAAMLKNGEPLLGAGFDARVISLPLEDDPDTFLRREGPEALRAKMEKAREYFDFALEAHAVGVETRTLAGQATLVEKCAPLLRALGNEVQREAAITRLLTRLGGGLPREAIYRILAPRERKAASPERKKSPSRLTMPELQYDPLERAVLKLMLESFQALEIFRHELQESWLTDRRLDPWIMYFLGGTDEAMAMIAESESDPEYPLPTDPTIVYRILAEELPIGEPEHASRELLARLKRRHHKSITARLIEALRDTDDENAMKLLSSFQEESMLALRTELPKAQHRIE
ncbi:DNA primase [bacterium]|nr:DNA primase [bacterium]